MTDLERRAKERRKADSSGAFADGFTPTPLSAGDWLVCYGGLAYIGVSVLCFTGWLVVQVCHFLDWCLT